MADTPIEPMSVAMTVNGAEALVDIEPSESLSYTLRTRLGLTGTKVSCDVQACGACTVLVDGLPRSSCTYLTYEARGHDVLTVEGLTRDGELAEIQQAFIADSAFQCGFCTPGMLLTAHAYLKSEAEATTERASGHTTADPIGRLDAEGDAADEDLIDYMSGNLCRCTGYLPIVAAILRARKARAGEPAGTFGRRG